MSINQFTFTGTVTKAYKTSPDADGRSFLRLNVNIECGGENLWVRVEVRKKKLIEDVEDFVWAGNQVTVTGALEPRERDQTGPILVAARDIATHNVIVEVVDDGRNRADPIVAMPNRAVAGVGL